MPGDPEIVTEKEIRWVITAPEMLHSRTRIVEALIDIASGEDVQTVPIKTENELLFSLCIMAATREKSLASRFFIFMRDYYEYNLKTLAPESIEETLNRMDLSVNYDAGSSLYTIPFYQYIENTKRLTGSPYRLVFQSVSNGQIWLRKEVVLKIAREKYVKRLQHLYESINEEMIREISGALNEIPETIAVLYRTRTRDSSFELGDVDAALFPPCVSEYIKEMRDGVNLPHMARFTLVSFLHHIGMDNDGIIALFKSAPDYNERMTVYQVNHVSGETSGTEYSPPKCSVLESNHLCYKKNDTLCNQEWLKHPLQYYTIKKKPRKPKDAAQ